MTELPHLSLDGAKESVHMCDKWHRMANESVCVCLSA